MKAIDIIRRVDTLEPNQYGVEQKLGWLGELDGQIFRELLAEYDSEAASPQRYTDGDEELLVPFPYGESVYCRYLQAMIAGENFETAKYNQQISLYNSAYGQYRDWYIRNGTHQSSGAPFRF